MIQSTLQSSEGKEQSMASTKTSKPKITDEVRRAKLKTSATLRAQFNYRVALDRIDYNFDVIDPSLKVVEEGATRGELPEFVIVED